MTLGRRASWSRDGPRVFCWAGQNWWHPCGHPCSRCISLLLVTMGHQLQGCADPGWLVSPSEKGPYCQTANATSKLRFPMQVSSSQRECPSAADAAERSQWFLSAAPDRTYTYTILWVGLQRASWKHTGLYLPLKNKHIISAYFGTGVYQQKVSLWQNRLSCW